MDGQQRLAPTPRSGAQARAPASPGAARGTRAPGLKPALLGLVALAAALAAIVATLTVAPTRRGDQGAVHFLGVSSPAFDAFTSSRDPAYGAFLRQHFSRMVAYSPYFDDKTGWYPRAWAYEDAYAIYRGSAVAREHPEWILRDAAGNRLFIPFSCAQGVCPQFAADISNAAFRRHWIAGVRRVLAHGYRGLFVDDVNLSLRVSDGSGSAVAPIDRATGRPMTANAWRRYMAAFMAQIRAAFPHAEIAHNVEWLAGASDPYVRQELRAADYINLERGVNDPGLTRGSGPYALRSLLAYVDSVHALGRGVVLDGNAVERSGIEYSLAGYLLVSTGHDLVSAGGMTPLHWFAGFDANLGQATGPRRRWQGVLRRDFSGGMSLLAEPGSGMHHLSLAGPMRTLDGRVVRALTLGPAEGAVLERP